MKIVWILIILLVVTTPLLAEEITSNGEVSANKEQPSKTQLVLAYATIIAIHSGIMALFALLLGSSIIRNKQFEKVLKNQQITPEEIRLNKYCLVELVFSSWLAAIISFSIQLWRGPSSILLMLLLHLNLLLFIYEVLAMKINIRLFESKGIYHQVASDSWKRIKSL